MQKWKQSCNSKGLEHYKVSIVDPVVCLKINRGTTLLEFQN